ncbi:hypothetical protein EMCRGX_G016893 [Ephydatia muelleri]
MKHIVLLNGVHSSGSNLGEFRSLIPPHVHVLALTATVTVSSRNKIIRDDGAFYIIALSPGKANRSYWVKERVSVEETFAPLAAKLRKERTEMQKLSSSVDDVTTVLQYMTFSCPH